MALNFPVDSTLGLGPGWAPTPAGNNIAGQPMVTITLPTGQRVTVNASDASRFAGFLGTLGGANAPLGNIGSYNPRNIAGTNIPSQHAYGQAIDVGDQSGRNQVSPSFQDWYNQNKGLVQSADAQYGMKSGADWNNPDLGHFEVASNSQQPSIPIQSPQGSPPQQVASSNPPRLQSTPNSPSLIGGSPNMALTNSGGYPMGGLPTQSPMTELYQFNQMQNAQPLINGQPDLARLQRQAQNLQNFKQLLARLGGYSFQG